MNGAIDLGSKTFAMEDQCLMANWCGDHNPMHVDPVAARRLLTGQPVVHGVHLVLEALARWQPHARGPAATALRADFSKPVSVGDLVGFQAQQRGDMVVLTASVDGLAHMTLELHVGAPANPGAPLPQGESVAWSRVPHEQPAAAWLGRSVRLPEVTGSLPAADGAARLIGMAGATLLGQASTMVGMGCPGMHSVFASLSLVRQDAPGPSRCRAERHDPRFGLVRIAIDGSWRGELRAFVRAAPRPQATMAEVLAQVPRQLAGGHHTWVLGGSRGLGELAAKIAAAAGSRVTLSFAQGQADALRVAQEIMAAGCQPAQVVSYQTGTTDLAALCAAHGLPDTVLFFATPRIAQRRSTAFNPALLHSFIDAYCSESSRIALALEAVATRRGGGRRIRLFNPSSTYVDDLPNGMVEYAMAKAASEVLAQDLNKRLHHVSVVTHRLPKLLTDQTNGLISEVGPPALAVLGPVVLATLTAL